MNNKIRLSWEDARIFLCVSEHKSFSAAANILKIGQPTISRRIRDLEQQYNVQLFTRGKHGAKLTTEALSLIPAARQMAEWASEFHRLASAKEASVSGQVSIAAPPGIAVDELAPFAARLKQQAPKIQLEILSAIDYVDLSLGAADLAIRTQAPQEPGLIGLYHSTVKSVAMASKAYIENLQAPYSSQTPDWRDLDYKDLDWVTWGGRYQGIEPRPMLENLIPNFTPIFTSDDYLVLKSAVESGLGACIFNKPFGLSKSNLIEIDLGLNLPATEFYLVCSRSVQHIPRVRYVADSLISVIEEAKG